MQSLSMEPPRVRIPGMGKIFQSKNKRDLGNRVTYKSCESWIMANRKHFFATPRSLWVVGSSLIPGQDQFKHKNFAKIIILVSSWKFGQSLYINSRQSLGLSIALDCLTVGPPSLATALNKNIRCFTPCPIHWLRSSKKKRRWRATTEARNILCPLWNELA